MDFGYNDCPVQFGELKKGVSKGDMVRMASEANAEGFTYHPSLRYGNLMIGKYPDGCRSRSSLSWPLYLRVNDSTNVGTVGETSARPNLYISEFTLSPDTPIKGRTVNVRVGVYNRGTTPAGRFNVAWWPGENYRSPACTWTVESMAARGGRILQCRYDGYPSPYGSIRTKAVADTRGAVAESDESDNVRMKTIRVNNP